MSVFWFNLFVSDAALATHFITTVKWRKLVFVAFNVCLLVDTQPKLTGAEGAHTQEFCSLFSFVKGLFRRIYPGMYERHCVVTVTTNCYGLLLMHNATASLPHVQVSLLSFFMFEVIGKNRIQGV